MSLYLPFILKNTLRNKRRSILTVLSIVASVCLLGVLMALYNAFFLTPATPEQALRLWVRNRVSLGQPLHASYGPRIRQVPDVEEAMIFQWFGGTYKDARDPANFFARFAVEAEKLDRLYPEYRIPDQEQKAFLGDQTGCIVGRKTANRHNMKIGDRVTVVGDFFPVTVEMTIRGIYDAPRDNENLIFHYKYLNESLPREMKDLVGVYVVRVRSTEEVTAVSKAIDDMFRNSPMQTKTETEKAFEMSFLAFIGNVKMYLLATCAAVTFTILLVAGNTMAMSARERVREVGVLKTLGFTPGGIISLLVGEAVLIALLGGVIGLLVAYAVCGTIRESMPSTFADMSRIVIRPAAAVLGLAIAAFIGIISSLIPAWSAARRPITEALRFTD